MDAKKYKIEITHDIAHEYKSTINEVYIPQINTCINEYGYIFRSEGPRESIDGKYENIQVMYPNVTEIEHFLVAQEKINGITKEIFNKE